MGGVACLLVSRPGDSSRVLMMAVNIGGGLGRGRRAGEAAKGAARGAWGSAVAGIPRRHSEAGTPGPGMPALPF